MYNSSNQQGSVNDPQASNSDLQQISSSQSSYINQFIGSTPQSSYPQSANPMFPQQINPSVQQPPVSLSMNQTSIPSQQQTTSPLDSQAQTDTAYAPSLEQNFSQPMSNEQMLSSGLMNNSLVTEPMNDQLLNPSQIPTYNEISTPQIDNNNKQLQTEVGNQLINSNPVLGMPIQQNQPYVQTEPQSNEFVQPSYATSEPPMQQNQSYGNLQPQSTLTQQTYNPKVSQDFLSPNQQQNQPVLNNVPANSQSPVNIEPQVIGAQQVDINQDYAERGSNNQWLNTPLSPANQMQSRPQMPSQQYNSVIQNPATNLTVDHDFSDGTNFGDDSQVSTGFLPSFDDNTDDSLLPVVSDDNDDMFANADEPDAALPFGFSDYDPNEQISSSIDSLSGFESQSLEEEANRIDVDFSESMPTKSQSVGVLTQEPQRLSQTQMTQTMVPIQTASPVSYTAPTPTTLNQVEPQAQQATLPVDSELSPTARLNQLLEEEENAEKVIMEKQEQSVMKAAKTPKMIEPKGNIFKQTNDDVAFQGDIRKEMSTQKPTSRYFMIISMIIIISVIGFLLVLLGLTLL